MSDGFRHRGVEMGGRRTCWCNGECPGWAVVQVIYRERREVKEKWLGVVPTTRALESIKPVGLPYILNISFYSCLTL